MKKATLLKVLNPILLLLALGQVTSIVVIKISWSELIMKIHEWNGYAIGVIVLVHLILNWSWVRNSYFVKKKRPVFKHVLEKEKVT